MKRIAHDPIDFPTYTPLTKDPLKLTFAKL